LLLFYVTHCTGKDIRGTFFLSFIWMRIRFDPFLKKQSSLRSKDIPAAGFVEPIFRPHCMIIAYTNVKKKPVPGRKKRSLFHDFLIPGKYLLFRNIPAN